ncbi:MAG: cysteine--tRNA ligase [Acidobacteriota bacterium]
MLRFHDTLSRRKRPFQSLREGAVGIYTCGPTVHDYAHIGNFRAFVWEDLLCRYLRYKGYRVTQVMNITDVDDKTIQKATDEKTSLGEVTDRFIGAFFEDLKRLGVHEADHYPRATEHIPDMESLVQSLQSKDFTYESHGSIYFRIAKFPSYGKLTRLRPEALRSTGRGDSDSYDKQDVRDFALWKAAKPGEPAWETGIGRGRPGWHLECSAMSMRYLGETFDIHTGGVDNVFPHHENEIAQSEASTGKPFVRYWLHCAHLLVEGEKMSKSLGNFFTLRDLLAKGKDPMAIRYLLLSQHYRKPLNFTFEGLDWAAGNLQRLRDFRRRISDKACGSGGDPVLLKAFQSIRNAFVSALDDDLNTSVALAAVFEMVREGNAACDQNRLGMEEKEEIELFLSGFQDVFGLREEGREEKLLEPGLASLIEERTRARGQGDFARADAIRMELEGKGIIIEDTQGGVRWKRKR